MPTTKRVESNTLWSDINMLNNVLLESFAKNKHLTPESLNHILFLSVTLFTQTFGLFPNHGAWLREDYGAVNQTWAGKFPAPEDKSSRKAVTKYIPNAAGEKLMIDNRNFQACVAFMVEKYGDVPPEDIREKIINDPAFKESGKNIGQDMFRSFDLST